MSEDVNSYCCQSPIVMHNMSGCEVAHTHPRSTQDQADWERYLPLVLFAYRTAVHSSTRFLPFELMFGHPALTSPLPSLEFITFHVNADQFKLCSTLAQLKDFVEIHISEAAHCKTVHFKLATLSGCLLQLQENWNQGGRGVGNQIHQGPNT